MSSTISKRIIASVTTAAVAAGAVGGTMLIKKDKENSVLAQEINNEIAEADNIAAPYHSSTSGKTETVYVIQSSDGNRTTYVSSWLRNPDGSSSLNDVSDLSDIEVVRGDAALGSDDNGRILWNAEGGDIYYRGISDDELPVDVNVSYVLDGQSISAADLEGQSGHLIITVEYSNNMSEQLTDANGDEYTIYMPFMMSTGMVFDNASYANIVVDGGQAVNDGDRTIVMGIGFPGLYESLGLDGIDVDDPDIAQSIEDIDIPEQITIECDVTDGSSLTALTVASVLDLDDIEASIDTDSINDNIDEMTDGMSQLVDGSAELYDGVSALNDGAVSLNDGASELASGASTLAGGASSLASGAATLASGATSLSDGAASLSSGTASLANGAASLQNGIGQVNDGASQLNAGLAQVQSNIPALQSGVSDLTDGANALSAGATQLSAGVNQLYGQLTSEEASSQLNALIAGSEQFSSSLSQLDSALSSGGMTSEQAQALQNAIAYLSSYAAQTDDPNAAASISALITAYTTMAGQMGQIQAAVAALDAGYADINNGINTLGGRFGDVANAVAAIQSGAASVADGSSRVAGGLNTLNGSTGALADGINSLAAGANSLNNGTAQLVTGAASLADGANRVNNGAQTLATGASELAGGANALSSGANDLSSGAGTLSSGASELADGTSRLSDGVSALLDGAGELEDGLGQFNEEAVDKITDIISSLTPVQDRIDALREYAATYDTFSGTPEGVEDSVVFVFKS